jgi:HlyD family secretion protein
MTRRRIRWISMALLISAMGVLIWLYTQPKPIEVVFKPVERGTVERLVANTRAGTLKACRRANLSLSVGGQIAVLGIQEGDLVKAGQILLELWNKDLVAEVKLTENEAKAAAARAHAACLQAELAKREANRLVKLRKTGAASEERADKAITEAKVRKADCDAAVASANMSAARVCVAMAKLKRSRLIAPFDGVIAKITGELNEYVTPSPPGIATPPAVDLIDNTCFYVAAPIDEVDAPAITVAMPARISLDAFGDRCFKGKVRRVADYVLEVEKQARTVEVEVEFTNPEDIKHLLPGYSADVEVILDVHHDTLRIPTEAVMDGERVFVYLPDDELLEKRSIKIGISNWDYTEVMAGLQAGELVVISVDRAGVKDGAHAIAAKEES